jgi:hypothetical protein
MVVAHRLILLPEVCWEQPPIVTGIFCGGRLHLLQKHVVCELIPKFSGGSRRLSGAGLQQQWSALLLPLFLLLLLLLLVLAGHLLLILQDIYSCVWLLLSAQVHFFHGLVLSEWSVSTCCITNLSVKSDFAADQINWAAGYLQCQAVAERLQSTTVSHFQTAVAA